jgi:two-component system sensor histidine kinase MprB
MTTGVRFTLWAALSGTIAVLIAGLAAIAVVERSLVQVVDGRLEVRAQQVAGGDERTSCDELRAGAATSDRDGVLLIADAAGRELCRSSPLAPSARALGIADAEGVRTVVVDGDRWRVVEVAGGAATPRVVAAERIEADEVARADARRAIIVAMVIGAFVAAAGGAGAAVPARRRIVRLLDRIRAAGRDPSGTTSVGRIGGRDLDVAAESFDQLLADVRSADAAQRRLVSDAAHQLRTPITSIRTNAQLLERTASLDPEAHDLAARIARQAAAVSDLVAGLVDYTAATAWSGDRRRGVPLADVASRAVERAMQRWPDADIRLTADDSTGDVDEELVIRALGNLVDNAVVHGDGTIRVSVVDGTFLVGDAGDGFGGLTDDEAFLPFVSDRDGSGLGLAFVRHVARAHGGEAWIESSSPPVVAVRLAPVDATSR